jgi:hypothetical protein
LITKEAPVIIHLKFAHLRLHFRARECLKLPPYKGSTFRGAFGTTFKRTVCIVQHKDCTRCLIRNQCVYPYVFDTPVETGSGIFRGFSEAPHPYIIEPPLEPKTDYATGDEFEVGLVVIGRALHHLPYFIYTFQRLGETGIGRGRGKCDLISGKARQADGTYVPVYDGARETLSEVPILTSSDFAHDLGNRVAVHFLTPTQLKADQKFKHGLDFSLLVRGLLRRVSALSTFHGDGPPDMVFQNLVDQASHIKTVDHHLRWNSYERYSNRKQERMTMGGFVGQVAFEGDLAPFALLLQIGVPLHVGKGTSFGMGQYTLA